MVTAIVLTHKSASTLRKTLDSISWADEIICVDDRSADETVSIAKKYKVRVYRRALDNDFARQRNFGLEKATGAWVFFVDSDEVVTPELKDEIIQKTSNTACHSCAGRNPLLDNKVPAQGRNDIVGYFIKRVDFFLGRELKYGETANVRLLRLARKNAGTWVRPIHEIWNIQGSTETLDHPLLHSAHENVAQFISDMNRYSTINAAHLHSIGVRSNLFQILVYPKAKFLQNYFLKLGFLDGPQGFIMAMMMSFHSFLTRAKLYLLDTHESS